MLSNCHVNNCYRFKKGEMLPLHLLNALWNDEEEKILLATMTFFCLWILVFFMRVLLVESSEQENVGK